MKTHDDLIQGSDEWLAFRAAHFPASEAPAMLGESPYKTRAQLLREKHTGLAPDVDAATQRRFDDGHRFEALARPLAEEIIGEPLSPVTGSDGMLSASFDGITFMGDMIFEHKTLNEEIRAAKSAADLGLHYRIQMEQQLAVSGAERCLFMATKWNNDDELQEQVFHWYTPDLALRAKIMHGWNQFSVDLAEYQHVVHAEPPVPDAILQLPAVIINVTGALSVCNLDEVTPKFDAFLAGVNTDLQTDEDFANGEATAKFSREAAKTLKLKAREVVGQISTVSDAVNTLELYAEKFDALGLMLEKAVKEKKDSIKVLISTKAKSEFQAYCATLDDELRGHGLRFDYPMPDFGAAMKLKRTVAALRDAVNTELASAKAGAAQLAQTMREKIRLFKAVNGSQNMILFPDLQQIIQKAPDDFEMLVKSRIAEHQQEEAARLESERVRIQQEEEAKAAAKVRVLEPSAQVMQLPPATGEKSQVDTTAAVIEHQDEISTFLKSRSFKDESRIRAILVEFVKHQAERALASAA